jgi:GNAT superfamily N-acetyltransferase
MVSRNLKTKIRLAREKDINILSKIFFKVYTDFDVGEKWNEGSSYNLMSYWFKRQPDLFFIAKKDNKIIGAFVAGIKPWWDGNHLVDGEIFVDPTYQKQKVGTKLSIKMYEAAIKKYNIKYVDAVAFKNFEFPLNWHKSLGFNEVKEWTIISGGVNKILKNLKRKLCMQPTDSKSCMSSAKMRQFCL